MMKILEGIVGIADDIKPKINKPKKDLKSVDQIKNPDEVYIKFGNKVNYDFDNIPDHDLNKKENEFFNDDEFDEKSNRETKESRPVKNTSLIENDKKQHHGNPMTKWVILLILILIGILVWQNYSKITKFIGIDGFLDSSSSDSLNEYDSNISGTDYTTGTTGTGAGSSTSTQTTETPTSTAVTPAIDKSTISMEILNGNGISGSASAIKDQLTTAGFTISKVANAYNFNYTNTIIYYKTSKESEANLVKDTLTNHTCETINSDKIVGSYDIVVVVGKI